MGPTRSGCCVRSNNAGDVMAPAQKEVRVRAPPDAAVLSQHDTVVTAYYLDTAHLTLKETDLNKSCAFLRISSCLLCLQVHKPERNRKAEKQKKSGGFLKKTRREDEEKIIEGKKMAFSALLYIDWIIGASARSHNDILSTVGQLVQFSADNPSLPLAFSC